MPEPTPTTLGFSANMFMLPVRVPSLPAPKTTVMPSAVAVSIARLTGSPGS